jgi:hypothetical protein
MIRHVVLDSNRPPALAPGPAIDDYLLSSAGTTMR